MPQVASQEFCYVLFWDIKMSQFLHDLVVWLIPFAINLNKLHFAYAAKMYSKNTNVSFIMQVTKGALISS